MSDEKLSMDDALEQLLPQLQRLSETWDEHLVRFVEKAAGEINNDKNQTAQFLQAIAMLQTHAIAWVASDLRAVVHSIGMYQQAKKAAAERIRNYELAEIASLPNVELVELPLSDDPTAALDELREKLNLKPCNNPKCPVHGPELRENTKDNN